jgi:hypothetical protein
MKPAFQVPLASFLSKTRPRCSRILARAIYLTHRLLQHTYSTKRMRTDALFINANRNTAQRRSLSFYFTLLPQHCEHIVLTSYIASRNMRLHSKKLRKKFNIEPLMCAYANLLNLIMNLTKFLGNICSLYKHQTPLLT